MRQPQGYATIVDPNSPTREFDTITCKHCQRVVHIESQKDVQEKTGWCFKCGTFVCVPCADKGTCTPWEATMEKIEKAAQRKREVDSWLQ